uniref:(California timema) hypothetical protein n=1 Tax=Timema californicum TaxID=61474 RepID=A0A7R9JEV6_TIMCA|nr:unnamed protein product [Timema californicum]
MRLTPAIISLVVFYAYIWEHLGNGPIWNKVVKRNADLCKKSMWKNMLYVQNFYPAEEMCATHTHQLSVDMQLSLVAPLLVYLLFVSHVWGILLLLTLHVISGALRYYCATHTHQLSVDMQLSLVAPLLVYLLFVSHVWGILLLLTLHVISGALRYYVSVQNNLSMLIYIGITLNQTFRTANMTYTVPSHQATPYMFGIWLGYFLHKNDSKIHIPKVEQLRNIWQKTTIPNTNKNLAFTTPVARRLSIMFQLAPNRETNLRIPETRKRQQRLKDTLHITRRTHDKLITEVKRRSTHGTLQGTPTTNIHPRTEGKQTFHARHTTRNTKHKHRSKNRNSNLNDNSDDSSCSDEVEYENRPRHQLVLEQLDEEVKESEQHNEESFARRERKDRHLVYGGWLSAVYLLYLSFFSMSEVVSPEYQYDAVKMSIYYALSPVAFSLALSWVILACVTGHGDCTKSNIKRGLTIFSKISYSMYLTQFLVLFYNVGTTKTSQEFNAVTVYVSLFEFILVLLASTIMRLLFDLPMQEVKNILMDTSSKKKD